MMPQVADSLSAALAYAVRGWRVIPIPPGIKHPAMDRWQEIATTDLGFIHQWWTANPTFGVGIATGQASGIFVLDVDLSADKHGDDTLEDLEAEHGRLPDTVEAITGSGGRHLYFLIPPGAEIRNEQGGRLGPGLDIRGEGGQVLAPPTIHPNGTPYRWELSSHPDDVAVAEAPAWLVELLTARPEASEARRERAPRTGSEMPGDVFASSVTWPALLEADGATYLGTRTDARSGTTYELWARPGVTDHHGATLGYGGSDVLKVFTSSWGGVDRSTGEVWQLTEGATYSRFGYYAARHHGGDHSAAARALRAQQGPGTDIEEWIHALAAQRPTTPLDEAAAAPGAAEAPAVAGEPSIDLDELLASDEAPYDWLVPGLLERGDRLILTGHEGKGKSTLLRQVGVMVASGVHPFTLEPIEPVTVLYIDAENSRRQVRRKLPGLRAAAGAGYSGARMRFEFRSDGLDLTAAEDVRWLEERIQANRPDLVMLGPSYKLAMGDPKDEQTARAVAWCLDTLRNRYEFAVIIEAHVPYADSPKGNRPERPYGASLWSRWPEFGIYLNEDGALRHWRGQRDERSWPTKLERGMPWPWMVPTTPDGEVDVWRGPRNCMAAVVRVVNEGGPYSLNQLFNTMRALGEGYRKDTVSQAAEMAVIEGTLYARSGPRNARLYTSVVHASQTQGVTDETF